MTAQQHNEQLTEGTDAAGHTPRSTLTAAQEAAFEQLAPYADARAAFLAGIRYAKHQPPYGGPPNFRSTTHAEDFVHFTGLGVTVFMRQEDDEHWYVATARCSDKDQYCRQVGRAEARKRYFHLKNNGIKLPSWGTEKPTYDAIWAHVSAPRKH